MALEEGIEGLEMIGGLFSETATESAIARAIEEGIEMGEMQMNAARLAEQSAGYAKVIRHMEGIAQGFALPAGSDKAFQNMDWTQGFSSNKIADLEILDERTKNDIDFNKKMLLAWVNIPPRYYSSERIIGVWDKSVDIFHADKIGGIGTTYWPRENYLDLTNEHYIKGKDNFWKPVAYYPYKSSASEKEVENNTDELTWFRFNFDKWQWKGSFMFGYVEWDNLPKWIQEDDINIFSPNPTFEQKWNDTTKVGKNPITYGSHSAKGSATGEYKEHHIRWRAYIEPYSLYNGDLVENKNRLSQSYYYDDIHKNWLSYGKALYDFLENPDIAAGILYYNQTELKKLSNLKSYERAIQDIENPPPPVELNYRSLLKQSDRISEHYLNMMYRDNQEIKDYYIMHHPESAYAGYIEPHKFRQMAKDKGMPLSPRLDKGWQGDMFIKDEYLKLYPNTEKDTIPIAPKVDRETLLGRTPEWDRLEEVFSRLSIQFQELYDYFNDIYVNRPEEKLIRNSSVVSSMGEAGEGWSQSSTLAETLNIKNEANLFPYSSSLLLEGLKDEIDLNRRLFEVQERMVNQKKEESRIKAQKDEEQREKDEVKRKADELEEYIILEHQKNLDMYARASEVKRESKPKGRYQLYDEKRRQEKKDLQVNAEYEYEIGEKLWFDGVDKWVVRSRKAELTLNEKGVLTSDNPKITYYIRSDLTGNTIIMDDYNKDRYRLVEKPKPQLFVQEVVIDEEKERFLFLQKQYLYLLKLKSLL